MMRNIFYGLSNNKFLSKAAQKYGLQLGAKSVVAGTNVSEVIKSIKQLNNQGMECTIDNLGEFVTDKDNVIKSKNKILDLITAIVDNGLNAHLSIKPSQLGLDIDYDYCFNNVQEIIHNANQHNIFVNIDMEDYSRLDKSFNIVKTLSKDYDNIGTVIQALFYDAINNTKEYKNLRLRLVKGAYNESDSVAFSNKKDIDENFKKVIEQHLLNGKFTSIATHDYEIINHSKNFIKEHNISKDQFEFQMLYGFRKDLQHSLVQEGYNFCVYVPFGEDWYGYFMRRLAERPQNLFLAFNEAKNNKYYKPIIAIVIFVLTILSIKFLRGDKNDN